MKTIKSLKDLQPDNRNANRGTQRGTGLLEDSLQQFGAGRSVLADKNGRLIAGNKTVESAASVGINDVVVVRTDGRQLVVVQRTDLDLDDPKARGLAIRDNRIGEINLDWDADVLATLAADGVVLDDLWSAEELTELLNDGANPESGAGGDDFEAEPDETQTRVRYGDLWRCGRHRVLCGDSTKSQDVARLLDGAKPFLCVTDPPYGVDYDPSWRNKAASEGHLAYADRRIGPVANDDRADWREAWQLFPGDVIYTWHPAGATSLIHAAALQETGFVLRMQIIWAKSNFPIGRGDYHVRHEPCWYAVRKGQPAKRTGDRTQTTLWEINLDKNVEGGHSTQKPLECMERPIRNHEPCDVYDPFLGSGTTLIAVERTGRKCYGVEISPHYIDVILSPDSLRRQANNRS